MTTKKSGVREVVSTRNMGRDLQSIAEIKIIVDSESKTEALQTSKASNEKVIIRCAAWS